MKTNKKIIKKIFYGFIIGDACGVPFEFLTRDTFKYEKMIDCNESSVHKVKMGTWSDDTSLMLCVINAFAKYKNNEEIYEKYKNNCINWMYNGKFTADNNLPFDIGNTCRNGIVSMKNNIHNSNADNIYSNGNGGIMKVVPLAFISNEENKIMEYLSLINKNSHNHIISNVGCLIYIKILQSLINGETLENSINKLNISEKFKIKEYDKIWDGSIINEERNNIKSTGYVVDTLEAVIWSVINSNSFDEALSNAINLGGDTDTIGALTGALAAALYNDIPKDKKNKLRNQKLIQKNIKAFVKAIDL